MLRHLLAVVTVICLNPALLLAQGSELTIGVTSATVHKGPSTGSPVIGRVARGTRLVVTRDVGSWVRVAWPDDPSGAGYVHQRMGSLAPATAAAAPALPAAQPLGAPAPAVNAGTGSLEAQVVQSRAPRPSSTSYLVVPRHAFGLGARLGSAPSLGIGGSVRAWTRGPLGVQFDLSRHDVTNPLDLSVLRSTQFGPSVLMTLGRHVSEQLWVRPYAGGGISFHQSSLSSPSFGVVSADSTMGWQTFGGAEFTFATVPQASLSAELGHRWFDAPFAGYDIGGFGLGLAAHWYVR